MMMMVVVSMLYDLPTGRRQGLLQELTRLIHGGNGRVNMISHRSISSVTGSNRPFSTFFSMAPVVFYPMGQQDPQLFHLFHCILSFCKFLSLLQHRADKKNTNCLLSW
jgi:hypothetical protein